MFQNISELPSTLPVFPLPGALLLPRGQLPLNIFEPRYLALVHEARAQNIPIGIIQPLQERISKPAVDTLELGELEDNTAVDNVKLYATGCAGNITSWAETEDGRILLVLTGICRFSIREELEVDTPYRQCAVDYRTFKNDLNEGHGEEEVNRALLLETLEKYLNRHDMKADWDAIHDSSNEQLVNSLAMIGPFGIRERQALLEADSLNSRNNILIGLTEMDLMEQGRHNDSENEPSPTH
ncbi:MAG: LON peptidase substrate-binding domain-containing protein [Hyphomicrobiales bacterium]|nr:LON peptidase substrate-binding domain-containing protein [Hyphomicrobiales bacterium]